MGIVVEAPDGRSNVIERVLAGVPKRRVPEIVREGQRLGEVLVQRQHAGQRARDLCNLERVRKPRTVVVALVLNEHLRLVFQPPEGRGMDDPIPVALMAAPGWAFRLGNEAAAAGRRMVCVHCQLWGSHKLWAKKT